MTYRAAVALGSNLPDRLDNLRQGVDGLAAHGIVISVSPLYETAPVGGPDQGAFLNAVAVLDTELAPGELLEALQGIEAGAGRQRAEHWGPRTLDLDIITMLDGSSAPVVLDAPHLTIPHPRAAERRFVLEPLADVWPEAPLGPVSAGHLLGEVGYQDVERLGEGWAAPAGATPARLVAAQALALGVYAVVLVATMRLPPNGGRAVTGGILAVAGLALALWAAARLGPALTPLPEPRPGTTLVDSGPYRWVRHPIYTGIVAALVGLAVLGGSWPALVVGLAAGVFFWFKAGYEESRLRLMVAGYPDYMRRVAGRLVPRPRKQVPTRLDFRP